MNPSLASTEGAAPVIVHLSQVPLSVRVAAVDKMVALSHGSMSPREEADYRLAAAYPVQDPPLLVPAEKADCVLRARKLPPGQMPRVWTW